MTKQYIFSLFPTPLITGQSIPIPHFEPRTKDEEMVPKLIWISMFVYI